MNSTSPPMPHLPGVTHRWVDVGGVELHVAEAGEGPPILLLHGWPQHWWCWHEVVPLLDGFRLVMPDLRGFGWSAAPDHGYDKETLAGDVLGLMDALGIERAGLIGHDWGGWVGFLACLRAPERFDGLLAVGITHPFARLRSRHLAHAWRFVYQLVIGAPFLGRALLGRSTRPLDAMLRAASTTIDDPGVYSSVLTQPGRARASEQLYRTFLLREVPRLGRYRNARLRVPVRLVVGSEDPVIRPALLDGWEGHADDMTVVFLDGVGHFVPEDAPHAVAERARDLFDPGHLVRAAAAAGGTVQDATEVEGPNSA